MSVYVYNWNTIGIYFNVFNIYIISYSNSHMTISKGPRGSDQQKNVLIKWLYYLLLYIVTCKQYYIGRLECLDYINEDWGVI